MAKKLNGINSLAYLGVNSPNPPKIIEQTNAPTENNFQNFDRGDIWIHVQDTGKSDAYILLEFYRVGDERKARWVRFVNSEGDTGASLTGDIGGPVPFDGDGNLNIVGTNGITVNGDPGTNTLTIEGTMSDVLITTFTANDTWTKNADAAYVRVHMWGGGGGGGSGRRGTTGAAGGGGGGASGSFVVYQGPASLFNATEAVVVGAGGTGGIAQTIDNTDGNDGTAGGNTSFGSSFVAPGGAAGLFGRNGATPINPQPIALNGLEDLGTTRLFGGPGGSGQLAAGSNSNSVETDSTNLYTYASFSLTTSGAGGGGADSVTPRDGGIGGSKYLYATATGYSAIGSISGGIAGVSDVSAGGNGIDGQNDTGYLFGGTGGGGGGGYSAVVATKGGNGGLRGGGGGGGGGSLNGNDSGAGGNGGRGEVVIFEYINCAP